MRHVHLAALMGIVLLSTACGSKPPPVAAAPPEAASRPESTRPDDSDASRNAAAEEEARRREEESRKASETLAQMVFFDFDVSSIRDDQRPVLEAKARILRADPSIRLRIEGHADDRGSTEYNLALGARRAEAVRDYLAIFGLERSRFETVTYGEERPLVEGRGETSWARNRRGEFVVSHGTVATPDREK